MIAVDVVQGTQEWLEARLGIPTASRFDSIITPKTLKESSSKRYLHELVAERLIGRPVDDASTDFMKRGTDLEASAISAYEFANDCDTTAIGFALHDSGLFGCSPDRLVGDDGILEIKCHGAIQHVAALLGGLDDEHMLQVQGQLLVTGRKWCDLFFFNPEMPTRTVRIQRNEGMIAGMLSIILSFCKRVDDAVAEITGSSAVVVEDSPAPPAAKPPKRRKREAVEEATGNAGGTTPAPAAETESEPAPEASDDELEPTDEQAGDAAREAQLQSPEFLLSLCEELEKVWKSPLSVVKPSQKDKTKMWFTNTDMLREIGSMASDTMVQPLAFFQTTDPNKMLDAQRTYALCHAVMRRLDDHKNGGRPAIAQRS